MKIAFTAAERLSMKQLCCRLFGVACACISVGKSVQSVLYFDYPPWSDWNRWVYRASTNGQDVCLLLHYLSGDTRRDCFGRVL